MPKELWEVRALVPGTHTHALDAVFREIGAKEILFRPYRNGHDAPPQKPVKSIKKMSAIQQAWLIANTPATFATIDLRDKWVAAGFRRTGLIQALGQGVKLKAFKKLAPGKYRRLSNG